jgi:hypothetical protein
VKVDILQLLFWQKLIIMSKPKILSKSEMYQENIIAVKYVEGKRNYESCGGVAGIQDYIVKDISGFNT